MLLNPDDDNSLLRIANVPARGLSEVTMERLLAASQERKCSVFTAMKNPLVVAALPTRARQAIEDVVRFIETTRAGLLSAAGTPDPTGLRKWAEHFLAETGFLEEVRRSEKNREAGEGRVRNIRELAATLDGDTPDLRPLIDRLEQFLEQITLEADREEDDEAGKDAVTLITMHSCKGLEFPHVHIVGVEDGLLPHARSKEENTVEEERRLFYVAVTRAMQTLALSYCCSRKSYGALLPRHPSPFLKELPAELVEDGDAKGKEPVKAAASRDLFAAMRAVIE
jgi:superfamily I DNA/RNA helicase